jgi:ribose/xylose/arabinose/galactoside ABC-type transport system permease subunit
MQSFFIIWRFPFPDVVVATTMALTIKVFDLSLQHFLSLCPIAMALFKFWWFLMLALPRLTLIGFCGAQHRCRMAYTIKEACRN